MTFIVVNANRFVLLLAVNMKFTFIILHGVLSLTLQFSSFFVFSLLFSMVALSTSYITSVEFGYIENWKLFAFYLKIVQKPGKNNTHIWHISNRYHQQMIPELKAHLNLQNKYFSRGNGANGGFFGILFLVTNENEIRHSYSLVWLLHHLYKCQKQSWRRILLWKYSGNKRRFQSNLF